MSRRVGQVIEVETDDEQGAPRMPGTPRPQRFVWRGVSYRVRAIWATWHLRDRWWAGGEAGTPTASDRRYYRVFCANGLQCDLYHDAANGIWVLDRVHD